MERQAEYVVKCDALGTSAGFVQPQATSTLQQAAEQVIDLDSRARRIALGASRQIADALDAAMVCGQWLLFAKEKAGHGNWYPWLESVGITHQTAGRYMNLANRASKRDLINAKSVTDAMRLAGVIKEPADKGKPSVHDQAGKTRLPDTLETVNAAFMRWLANDIDERMENANDALLCQWEKLLRPMHQTYEQVKSRLNGK